MGGGFSALTKGLTYFFALGLLFFILFGSFLNMPQYHIFFKILFLFVFLFNFGGGLVQASNQVAAQEVWHTLSEPQAQAFEELLDIFNTTHPNYALVARRFNHFESLQLALKQAKNSLPQWVQWSGNHSLALNRVVAPNTFETLQKFLAAELALPKEVSAAAVAAFRNNQGQWEALPLSVAVPVVMYRTAAFESVGLPIQPHFADWKALQNVAYRLRESAYACGIASPFPAWVHLENISAWHGQAYTSKNDGAQGQAGAFIYNQLLQLRHLALMMSWAKSDLLALGDTETVTKAWAQGQCPILLGPSTALGALPSGQKERVMVTLLPRWAEAEAQPAKLFPMGEGLYLLRSSTREQKKAAVAFSNFWFQPEIAARWHESTGSVPLTAQAQLLSQKRGFYERVLGWGGISERLAGDQSQWIKSFYFHRRQEILAQSDQQIMAAVSSGKAPKLLLDDTVRMANQLQGASVR